MSTSTTSGSSVLDKFRKIEYNFNKNYLVTLFQIKQIVEDEEDEKEKKQLELLDDAYTRWFYTLQKNNKCMDACHFFYDAVADNHELLKARDEQLWTKGGDFFSRAFDKEGLDTVFLYNMLDDGLDESEEKSEQPVEDAKSNLWNALMGLYRLAVLICIYLKMPLVKEIIDMILINNPDLNQKNIFEKIFKEFKSKRRLRRLIMKLLKSKEDSFGDIFTSLQRVISTFSSEVNMDKGMKANLDVAKEKISNLFDNILTTCEVTDLKSNDRDELLKAIEDKDEEALKSLVDRKVLSDDQLEKVQNEFKVKGLDKMNVTKVVRDLGGTMEKMMSAINNGSEEEMKKVLEESGAGLNFGDMDMEKLQGEMENFEKEFEDEEDEGDSDSDSSSSDDEEDEKEKEEGSSLEKSVCE